MPELAPDVISLGHRNQPCFYEGNWQAHDWALVELHWEIDPNCDCLPFGGVSDELKCRNCGIMATAEEVELYLETHPPSEESLRSAQRPPEYLAEGDNWGMYIVGKV